LPVAPLPHAALFRPSVWRNRKEAAAGASQEHRIQESDQLATSSAKRRQTGATSHFPGGQKSDQEDEEAASLVEQLAWLQQETGVLAAAKKARKAEAAAEAAAATNANGDKASPPGVEAGSAGSKRGRSGSPGGRAASSPAGEQEREQDQHIVVNRHGQQVALSQELLELWQAGLMPGLDELLEGGMPSNRVSPRRKGRRHHMPASSKALEMP
jgi:hypothetical protein